MRVMVFGSQYNTNLGLVRSLGASGHEVFLFQRGYRRAFPKALCPSLQSKYLAGSFLASAASDDEIADKLITAARNFNPRCIIPGDDISAAILDSIADSMPSVHCPSIMGRSGLISTYSGKLLQVDLARKCGLNVPETWLLKTKDNEQNMSDLPFPVFCKAESRITGSKGMMRKCNSASELKTYLRDLAKSGYEEVLVQEYIRIDEEFCISGVAYEGDVFMPYVIKKLLRAKASHAGIAIQGKLYLAERYPEIIAGASKLMKNLAFTGLFDFDFFISSGNLLFCELNLRPGTGGYVAVIGGANLPAMYVSRLQAPNKKWDAPVSTKEGLVFYNDKALFEERLDRAISRKDALAARKESDCSLIYDTRDKKPYYSFVLSKLARTAKARIRTLIQSK